MKITRKHKGYELTIDRLKDGSYFVDFYAWGGGNSTNADSAMIGVNTVLRDHRWHVPSEIGDWARDCAAMFVAEDSRLEKAVRHAQQVLRRGKRKAS